MNSFIQMIHPEEPPIAPLGKRLLVYAALAAIWLGIFAVMNLITPPVKTMTSHNYIKDFGWPVHWGWVVTPKTTLQSHTAVSYLVLSSVLLPPIIAIIGIGELFKRLATRRKRDESDSVSRQTV